MDHKTLQRSPRMPDICFKRQNGRLLVLLLRASAFIFEIWELQTCGCSVASCDRAPITSSHDNEDTSIIPTALRLGPPNQEELFESYSYYSNPKPLQGRICICRTAGGVILRKRMFLAPIAVNLQQKSSNHLLSPGPESNSTATETEGFSSGPDSRYSEVVVRERTAESWVLGWWRLGGASTWGSEKMLEALSSFSPSSSSSSGEDSSTSSGDCGKVGFHKQENGKIHGERDGIRVQHKETQSGQSLWYHNIKRPHPAASNFPSVIRPCRPVSRPHTSRFGVFFVAGFFQADEVVAVSPLATPTVRSQPA
ncbi:uncharacterized protein MYCFIDRAFT_206908 [Pseudocercospora fijiensis CIRAD86]|uniref:Uncharacterized protein n=1 Tax=Pseudocercospora fijiensis (strain CIRAD86) TaxID=383855 RepID=M3BBV3_PSEFD|nr:uncharacterized protein MYCFIDRAFT_206908 [Pseudocercospora fijiensis CIRAD86]EME86678.1 hypothetical protein MYCFIDRAFT_206908 [Pseudocercospora fijiensis CIRAD86]